MFFASILFCANRLVGNLAGFDVNVDELLWYIRCWLPMGGSVLFMSKLQQSFLHLSFLNYRVGLICVTFLPRPSAEVKPVSLITWRLVLWTTLFVAVIFY
jgi:hypothetical protein